MTIQKRNTGIDIIRVLSCYLVLSVHFFLNNGFYDQTIIGARMSIMVLIRSGCMICVPLFMMMTGFLMNHKKLSKDYYAALLPVVYTYIVISIICILFKMTYLGRHYTFLSACLSITGFTGADYSWYIEQYLGIFLLIPFLNRMITDVTKREMEYLLLTLLFLTAMPGFFNAYRIEFWRPATSSTPYDSLIPDYWTGLYPITYYFLGAYIQRFSIKINPQTNIGALILCFLVNGLYNLWRSYGSLFTEGPWQRWGAIFNALPAFLLFVLLLNLNYEKVPDRILKLFKMLSPLCLGTYLISEVFDRLFYARIRDIDVPMRLEYLILVPLIFLCSMAGSAVVYQLGKPIYKYTKKCRGK